MKRFLLVICLALFSMSISAQTPPVVRIGSELFTESIILSQMVKIALDEAGIPTEDRTQLGGTDANRNALLNGQTDVYVEYTGTALFNFFTDIEWFDPNALNKADPIAGYSAVSQMDSLFNDLAWLHPAQGSNAYGLVVTRSFASTNGLATMSDFATFVNGGGTVLLVANEEFASRPDGLPAFEEAYGFDIDGSQLLVINGSTTSLTEEAVSTGVNSINVGMAFTTDALIDAYDLVLLQDNLGAQPLFQPAPVFRQEILAEYPQIMGILNPIFASITSDTLRTLNGRVDTNKETHESVARAYLEENNYFRPIEEPEEELEDEESSGG